MRLPHSVKLIKVALIASLSIELFSFILPAYALEGDVIRPYVSATYTYDDNFRRRPNKDSSSSDVIMMTGVGIILDKQVSQQNIYVDLNVNESKFNRNSEFDNTGKRLLAKWSWALGHEWSGKFEVSRRESMVPLADYRGIELNMRTQNRKIFDAMWRFHPSWRARLGVQRDDLEYSAEAQRYAESTVDTYSFGVDYLASSGSTAGIVYRHARGERPYERPAFFPGVGTVFINNDYTQQSLKADVNWILSGKTKVEFLGGYVSRKHDSFSERDFSGFNARSNATWSMTEKTTLKASMWRDANALSIVTSSYVVDSGISASLLWATTSKVIFTSRASYTQLKFQGDVTGQDIGREDRRTVLSAGVIYNPTQSFTLSTYLNRNVRDSSISNLNYNATSISLSGQYEF